MNVDATVLYTGRLHQFCHYVLHGKRKGIVSGTGSHVEFSCHFSEAVLCSCSIFYSPGIFKEWRSVIFVNYPSVAFVCFVLVIKFRLWIWAGIPQNYFSEHVGGTWCPCPIAGDGTSVTCSDTFRCPHCEVFCSSSCASFQMVSFRFHFSISLLVYSSLRTNSFIYISVLHNFCRHTSTRSDKTAS